MARAKPSQVAKKAPAKGAKPARKKGALNNIGSIRLDQQPNNDAAAVQEPEEDDITTEPTGNPNIAVVQLPYPGIAFTSKVKRLTGEPNRFELDRFESEAKGYMNYEQNRGGIPNEHTCLLTNVANHYRSF